MNFGLMPPSVPTLATAGGELFAVRRIYCVGRNYAEHAREMGADPVREQPFFFMKPADALLANRSVLPFPPMTAKLHHEIEMVVALGSGGADIPAAQAADHIFGYAVGLDMTRRDLQDQAKEKRHPWDMGKAFDFSAPCSELTPKSACGPMDQGRIALSVNGTVRQAGDLSQMIWSVPELISRLSQLVTLAAGDLLFTGTPAGIGAVAPGDQLVGSVEGLVPLTLSIG
jgi:fumarylpyruvate hydrolase